MLRHSWMIGAALLCLVAPAWGQEGFKYKESKSGPAELRYFGQVPVMFVEGTPQEIGAQTAALVGDAAPGLTDYFTNAGQTNNVVVTLDSVDGQTTSCTWAKGECDDTEQTLDMTQAISMAPGMMAIAINANRQLRVNSTAMAMAE